MSGTSMDGIDAALIETDGEHQIAELGDISCDYDADFGILLKSAEYAVRQLSGNLPAAKAFYQQAIEHYLQNELGVIDTDVSTKVNQLSLYFHGDNEKPITFDQVVQRSTELHADIVSKLLKKTHRSPDEIDVIGYHGQTLLHRPSAKITVQVGDGALLAKITGITVVNDFRRRDVFSGGQGAPFAPLYHQALAIRDHKIPTAVVNCGGIANVTVITGKGLTDVVGFDTGPGNGLIDRYIKQRTHGKESMDRNAKYGSSGRVNEETIKLLYEKSITSHSGDFFRSKPPKSLDIADFSLIPELNILSIQDACATLEAFTADAIVHSTEFFDGVIPTYWILAGGGWNNPVIRRELDIRLKEKLGSQIEVMTADEVGWNSRALEAQIFAYLAVRSLMNLPISVPGTTLVPKPLCGGHAHLPQNGTTPEVAKWLKQNPDILSGYFNKKSSNLFL